jgi:hypothetical protein
MMEIKDGISIGSGISSESWAGTSIRCGWHDHKHWEWTSIPTVSAQSGKEQIIFIGQGLLSKWNINNTTVERWYTEYQGALALAKIGDTK